MSVRSLKIFHEKCRLPATPATATPCRTSNQRLKQLCTLEMMGVVDGKPKCFTHTKNICSVVLKRLSDIKVISMRTKHVEEAEWNSSTSQDESALPIDED